MLYLSTDVCAAELHIFLFFFQSGFDPPTDPHHLKKKKKITYRWKRAQRGEEGGEQGIVVHYSLFFYLEVDCEMVA